MQAAWDVYVWAYMVDHTGCMGTYTGCIGGRNFRCKVCLFIVSFFNYSTRLY